MSYSFVANHLQSQQSNKKGILLITQLHLQIRNVQAKEYIINEAKKRRAFSSPF
jgi:hypothetical protein